MKKMTAAVLAALLMSPLGTSFYAACEAASTDLRVSSASSQPLPPSPPPDGMPPQGMPPQGGSGRLQSTANGDAGNCEGDRN